MKIPRAVESRRSVLLLLALLLGSGCPPAPTPDDDSADDHPSVVLSPAVRDALAWPAGPVPDRTVVLDAGALCPAEGDVTVAAARDALRDGDGSAAIVGFQAHLDGGGDDPDGAVHLALGLLRHDAGEHEAAVALLDQPPLREGPLAGEAGMHLGLSLEELERPAEAVAAYRRVPLHSRHFDHARVRLAALVLADGETEGAITALLPLLSDPAQLGSRWRAEALVLLGDAYRARGAEGDAVRAYQAYRTAWATDPLDDAAARARDAMDALEGSVPASEHPTLEHTVSRIAALHERGHWSSTIEALEAIEGQLSGAPPLVQCEARYFHGRSLYKKRRYDDASPYLFKAVEACDGVDDDLAVQSIYLKATALDRRDQDRQAIETFLQLPARFPDHSYADDGYLKAAILELEGDDLGAARALLQRLVDEYPRGDMYGEALWRLAWADYRAGDPDGARASLRRLRDEFPPSRDRQLHLRARYWEAKVAGWPAGEGAVHAPPEGAAPLPAPDTATALRGWSDLADEHPLSYYGALAHSRLRELDPEGAAALDRRLLERRAAVADLPRVPAELQVDAAFWDRPQREIAQALICAGLSAEGNAELLRARSTATPWDWHTEQAIAVLAEQAHDWHASHNTIRVRFRTDHPEQLGRESWSALQLAYPLAYRGELVGAVAGKGVAPDLFQGLVREESAYQPAVSSWAGAMGLSQLMWPTAKDTARKMGITGLRRSMLSDPATNLAIGATYLDWQLERFDGNPACALAAYNAGPGAVERWLRARSGYPVDEWVEEIPYKETRDYTRRCLESYQTYHHLGSAEQAFIAVPLRVPTREPREDE